MRKSPPKKSKKNQPKRMQMKPRTIALLSLAVLLAAGAIVAVCLLTAGGRTVMTCGGIRVKEDLYSYWLSEYKYQYLADHASEGAADTAAFWAKDAGDGKTEEEKCRALAEAKMSAIISAASRFEALGGELTAAERASLSEKYAALLQYDVKDASAFNRRAKALGFTYKTVRRALLYEYEAEKLGSILYGSDGTNLSEPDKEAYYKSAYRHAMILEVRTVSYFRLDGDGKPVQSAEDGSYEQIAYTAEERAEKEALVEEITSALHTDGSYSAFERLLNTYNEDINRNAYKDGYFFSRNSGFSSLFARELPNVLDGILSAEVGTWQRFDTATGAMFVYVTELPERPYKLDGNKDFFNDFAANAANALYVEYVKGQLGGVGIRRKVADAISLPKMGTDPLLYSR